MNKSSYANLKYKSKVRRLYILLAVAMPFAVVAIAWALIADSFFVAAYHGTLLLLWIIYVVYVLFASRKISKLQEADGTHRAIERTSHRRRNVILERAFWSFVLLVFVTSFVLQLYNSASLYVILATIWAMIVSTGHLLYVGPLTDK